MYCGIYAIYICELSHSVANLSESASSKCVGSYMCLKLLIVNL